MKDMVIVLGIALLCILGLVAASALAPEFTLAYKQGVLDTKREAFNHGFMTKEIDNKDNVIYRWIEPHKYNEQ
jgi:hypothetical protein